MSTEETYTSNTGTSFTFYCDGNIDHFKLFLSADLSWNCTCGELSKEQSLHLLMFLSKSMGYELKKINI